MALYQLLVLLQTQETMQNSFLSRNSYIDVICTTLVAFEKTSFFGNHLHCVGNFPSVWRGTTGRGEGVGHYSWGHRGGQDQQPPVQGPLCGADGGGVGHQAPPQTTAHPTPEGTCTICHILELS